MDELVEKERVRRGEVDWNEVRERRVWRSIEASRARPAGSQLRWPRLAALSVGFAAAGAISAAVLLDATNTQTSRSEQNPQVSSALDSPFAPQVIALRDGSTSTVRSGEVKVISDDDKGGAFRQRWGTATYEIAPQKGRRVRVLLPKATIEVIGTVFRVQVDKESEAFSVDVLEGTVVVQHANEAVRLTESERFNWPAQRNEETHRDEDADRDETTVSQMIDEIVVEAPARRSRRRARPKKVALGDSRDEPPPSTADLFAQADEARRRGQSARAIEALSQVLAQSEQPSARATAHFTLAKVHRDQGEQLRASKHFLKAYHVHPRGPVGEDALAEAIVLLGQLPSRGTQLAKLIETYEKYFAQGTHRKRVHAVKAQIKP